MLLRELLKLHFLLVLEVLAASPPRFPPEHMLEDYTRGGLIPLEHFYVDDTIDGERTHYMYSQQQLDDMEKAARVHFEKIQSAVRKSSLPPDRVLRRLRKEDWLHFSLLNHSSSILKKRVVVIGSMTPWVETLCLALGADSVTTLEYNRLTYGDEDNRMKTVAEGDFDTFYKNEENGFDAALSLSSLDHDGLGRYGDPLNPNGDVEAMSKIRSIVKPGGLLFLTIPVGPDIVVFNLHRRYGTIRLPLLLDGWEEIVRVGWSEDALTQPANWRQTYEPVFILRKPRSDDGVGKSVEL